MAEKEDSNTIQSGTQLFLPFALEVEFAVCINVRKVKN